MKKAASALVLVLAVLAASGRVLAQSSIVGQIAGPQAASDKLNFGLKFGLSCSQLKGLGYGDRLGGFHLGFMANLLGIAGTIVDGLNNELLRSPVEALNATIQFAVEHRGQQVDKTQSRIMRQASLRVVKDLVTPERKLIASGYDAYLGEVNVLIKFEKAWVECQVFYGQPVNCKQVGTVP